MSSKSLPLCLALLTFTVGCGGQPSTNSVPTDQYETQQIENLDEKQAREFSDALAQAIADGNHDLIYARMFDRYRDGVSVEDSKKMLTNMYATYGRPLEFEYKLNDLGKKQFFLEQAFPIRKFWYAVRTEKSMKGKYFLTIEVANHGQSMASVGFAIVAFSQGVPPRLQ